MPASAALQTGVAAPARPVHSPVGFASRRERVRTLLKATDLLSLLAGFLIPAALQLGVSEPSRTLVDLLSLRLRLVNVLVFAALLAGWHLCLRGAGLYRLDRPALSASRLPAAMAAVGCSTALLAAFAALARIELVGPDLLVAFAGGSAALLVLSRAALAWARSVVSGAALRRRRVLIAGSGPRATRLALQLESDPDTSTEIVGYTDEHWSRPDSHGPLGAPRVCELSELRSYLRDHVIDELVVALPLDVLSRVHPVLLAACREQGVTLRYPVSTLVDVPPEASSSGRRADDSLVTLYWGVVGGWPLIAKRAFDLVLAVPLSLAALPIIALAAIAIKLESRGPVFFTQDRVGLNKRIFRIYKLRTMVSGAESQIESLEPMNEIPGPTFKLTHDPRVTPLGRLLRSTSIDELPQLWNVLRGDMTLVGPRPLSVRDVRRFNEDAHLRRFSVLPGLTGLWQVSGRSSVQFEQWMQLDLQYIDQWSLLLDLKLLLKTIPVVLLRTGAK